MSLKNPNVWFKYISQFFSGYVRILVVVIDGLIDWFIPTEKISNRTGSWYFGVVSIKGSDNVSSVIDDTGDCKGSGLKNDLLDKDFKTVNYTLVFYTSGGYSFNTSDGVDVWEARGM